MRFVDGLIQYESEEEEQEEKARSKRIMERLEKMGLIKSEKNKKN